MSTITVTRTIDAPLSLVFETVSDINNFSNAVDNIINVEFLSEQQSGVGSRFRETRIMNGREASTELEVTEFINNEHIRMVSDAGGTIWDSLFSVKRQHTSTMLILQMEARPHKLLAQLTTPLMKYFIQKALEKDMDAIKSYCEELYSQ